ncbi:hypothetical protein EMCLV152R [Equine molluscum contagiosum-like virus]|nr:hypothetical protein EMCLV152R [Equine molluscum contagiosum-like virus]
MSGLDDARVPLQGLCASARRDARCDARGCESCAAHEQSGPDAVDLVLQLHDAKQCCCFAGYRAHVLWGGSLARRQCITDKIREHIREHYDADDADVRAQMRVCAKRMLHQDVACLLYALRYAGSYVSGIAMALKMVRECYCPHVYPGLEVLLPSLREDLLHLVERGDCGTRATLDMVLGRASVERLEDVIAAQQPLLDAIDGVFQLISKTRRFFQCAYRSTETHCTCVCVDGKCPHPCTVFDSVLYVDTCMSARYIERCLLRALPHVACARMLANKAARRCVHALRTLERALLRQVCEVLPGQTTPSIESLYRTRAAHSSCGFYEAIRHVVKANPCIAVEVLEPTARTCLDRVRVRRAGAEDD